MICQRPVLATREQPVVEPAAISWKCRLGRHAYALLLDDNPEMHGRRHHVCVSCGKYFQPKNEEEAGFDVETYRRHSTYLN